MICDINGELKRGVVPISRVTPILRERLFEQPINYVKNRDRLSKPGSDRCWVGLCL